MTLWKIHLSNITRLWNTLQKIKKAYKYEDSSENFKSFQECTSETYLILILSIISKIIFFQYKDFSFSEFANYMKNSLIIAFSFIFFSHIIFITKNKPASFSRMTIYMYFMFFLVLVILSFINTYTYI